MERQTKSSLWALVELGKDTPVCLSSVGAIVKTKRKHFHTKYVWLSYTLKALLIKMIQIYLVSSELNPVEIW